MVVDGLHVTCMHHMHMHTLHAVHGSRVRAQPSQQASKPVRGARWRVLRREANDVHVAWGGHRVVSQVKLKSSQVKCLRLSPIKPRPMPSVPSLGVGVATWDVANVK